MRLINILFVLSAAATANAILIPTDNDDSPKVSSTSSQVSGPTNEPSPGTSDDWQQPMDIVGSSTFNEDWKKLFDQINLNTPNQGQQQTIDVASPSSSNQMFGPTNQPSPSTFNEDWKKLFDQINLNTPNQGQQQTIDVASPSSSNQGRQQLMDQPGPNTFKQGRKRQMDRDDPSTLKRVRKQPMDDVKTVSNRKTSLVKASQIITKLKEKFREAKQMERKTYQAYTSYEVIGFRQRVALVTGQDISGSTYDPEVEKQLKQDYEKASKEVNDIGQKLRFMKRHV
ncbi:hypothetical protein O5D80_001901 [Batrachochytrium dendrobatidis]|nr:hypothetical protein O5D80_000056 [Batrachochytrium dendrobatidis]KAJ8329970.1 hypothetical protein O5D80_001901 [Batrachochytrium dendrobatidis]